MDKVKISVDRSLFLFMVLHFIKTIMYQLCIGYDNDYWIMYFIGIMDNYGRIMVELWALSTIIDDYEVFFKKTHNKDIIQP